MVEIKHTFIHDSKCTGVNSAVVISHQVSITSWLEMKSKIHKPTSPVPNSIIFNHLFAFCLRQKILMEKIGFKIAFKIAISMTITWTVQLVNSPSQWTGRIVTILTYLRVAKRWTVLMFRSPNSNAHWVDYVRRYLFSNNKTRWLRKLTHRW